MTTLQGLLSAPDNYIYSFGGKKNAQQETGYSSQSIGRLITQLQSNIIIYDTTSARLTVNSLITAIESEKPEGITLSDSYYFIGVYNLIVNSNSIAIIYLRQSITVREKIAVSDEIYARCLYNLGVGYFKLGDFIRMKENALRSVEIEKTIYGETSPELIKGYSSLVTACLELKQYDQAIAFGNDAINLIKNTVETGSSDIADLYTNIGVCYSRISDFSKAALYLEKAESLYLKGPIKKGETYINLLNSLASTYFFLNMRNKSDEYFEKGIRMAESSISMLSFLFINNFAIILGNAGEIQKGEALIKNSLSKARKYYGTGSRDYIEVLNNYAQYLSNYNIDIDQSLKFYEQCIAYIEKNSDDLALREPVMLGYSNALLQKGENFKALQIIQSLIFKGNNRLVYYKSAVNPAFEDIEADNGSLSVLKSKYKILWKIYEESGDNNFLLAAAETSDLILSVLEKVRINISEEESRIVLGDKYRDSYLLAIRDFDLCYKMTGNMQFLAKAFEFSEKSKVAGLLASTRELKASQFHIPDNISELERKLQSEISFYNSKVSDENSKINPDSFMVSEWRELILQSTRKRDSLINIFEKQFPGYYLIKYNTQVIRPDDIPSIAGSRTTYLNYVLGDTSLYIFIVNKKFRQLISIPVDSSFFRSVKEFRKLLSMPSPQGNAKNDYMNYQEHGLKLYKTLVEPVRQYLVSDKVLISPDYLLSYIPFEAIPVSKGTSDEIRYKDLHYLMNDLRISYTYSATFMAESVKNRAGISNTLIAFAPVYTGTLEIDSLLLTRQYNNTMLHDLPFAREEAEYVSSLTGGKLFLNNEALESVFKDKAGNYDIIHLSMHTLLNDRYPMHSKMIFYAGNDSPDDGFLNTFEVYGLPLKAKMVVLSSCNTGMGTLHSGEGLLSLARGFTYSGGQSVVMSMWEVDDKSGTQIVKYFYRNLKKGMSKSNALRKARIHYLKDADMLRSHPYFWSTLVIYGNNSPLYLPVRLLMIPGLVIMIIAGFLIYRYLRSR